MSNQPGRPSPTPPEQPNPVPPPPPGVPASDQPLTPESSGPSRCLIGCLIVVLVLVGLLVLAVVLGARYARPAVADLIEETAEQAMEQSRLPEAQKEGVMEHVSRLAEGFRAGEVSWGQLRGVAEEFARGPLVPAVMIWGTIDEQLGRSGLPEDARHDARVQADRFVRGLIDGRLSRFDAFDALQPVSEPGPGNQPRLKTEVTDEELRQFISRMKAHADEAGIPAEPADPDIAAEVGRMIDRALGMPEAPAAPPQPE